MAFTASQLSQIESAIITVAAGGVAEIEDAFGNKTKYTSLDQLMKLKKLIEDDIARNSRDSWIDKGKFSAKT